MFSQSLVQVPVKYVSVQCRGGLITVLYGTLQYWWMMGVYYWVDEWMG